jgi:hypothetical protein
MKPGMRAFTRFELRLRGWTRAAIHDLTPVQFDPVLFHRCTDLTPKGSATPVYAESEVLAAEKEGRHRVVAKRRLSSLVKSLIKAAKAESLGGILDRGVEEQNKLAVENHQADLLDKLESVFNIHYPWRIERVELSNKDLGIRVHMGHVQDALWPCRKCYRPWPVYDYGPLSVWKPQRSDRPIMLGRMPRVRCPKHGVYQISPRTKSCGRASPTENDQEPGPLWVYSYPGETPSSAADSSNLD